MGLLDAVGLFCFLLILLAGFCYCFRRCCQRDRAQHPIIPRGRCRRQKNARRKRRRRRETKEPLPSTVNNETRPPLLPTPNSHSGNTQCTVHIYPRSQQSQQGFRHPPYPQQPIQAQHYPQQQFQSVQHPPPQQPFHTQQYPFNQHPIHAINSPSEQHMEFYPPPPPYESQPQGPFQDLNPQSQHNMNFFPQVPPPPYDTQQYPPLDGKK